MSHRERRITVHTRKADRWIMRVAITDGRVSVAALIVDDIYRGSGVR